MEYQITRLQNIVGEEAFDFLLKGGLLKIWRRRSPNKWSIEKEDGSHLWLSDDHARDYPSILLFDIVWNSSTPVPVNSREMWVHIPETSHYRLKRSVIEEYNASL